MSQLKCQQYQDSDGGQRIDVVAGHVSPARTQSTEDTGTSPSSISSPGPCTPPVNERTSRSRTRDDRRPLHRRGKSKCLETLEDLLREAGYEETRISTPEDEEMKGGERSGMGAVVEFLSQFLPTSNSTSPETEQSTYYSRPTSPPQTSSSYATSEETTPRQAAYNVHSRLQQLQQEHEMGTPLPDRHLRDSHRSKDSSDSQMTVRPALAQPRPSRAGDYLRSMTSKASLMAPPPRPSSTPARSRAPFSMRGRRKTAADDDDDPSILFSQRGNGEAEDEVTYYRERGQPPLPPSWLETVTKAVLFGGHVGGPTSDGVPPPSKTQPPSLRPSRSTLSQVSSSQHSSKQPTIRRGLTDQTNSPMLAPPSLFTMLERGRAGRSESQVTRTRVVCRSAPGSRATSLTRRGSEKGRGRVQRRRKKGDHDDRLPSLARHHTEDDAWNNGRGVPSTANDVKNRYLAGGMSSEPHGAPSSDEEDDHDGELDLARMLLHPKRQNSIRSLRKHLDAVESGSAYGSRRSKPPKRSPLHDDDDWPYEEGDLGSGYVRRRGVADDEDDGDTQAFAQFLGTLDNGGRDRPVLPARGTRR